MVIQQAYEQAQLDGPQRVNAHKVQAIAASISYFKKPLLDEIWNGIGWRPMDAFSWQYLRDMVVNQDLEGLPVVAAGSAFFLLKICSQTHHLHPTGFNFCTLSISGWNIESIMEDLSIVHYT